MIHVPFLNSDPVYFRVEALKRHPDLMKIDEIIRAIVSQKLKVS